MKLTSIIGLLSLLLFVSKANGDEECKLSAIDMVFVMDQSGSVGSTNFKVALKAAAGLAMALDIGTTADKSRVGFVLFDSQANVVFKLDDYSNNASVYNAIMSSTYSGGGTNIAAGMDMAINNVFVGHQRLSVPSIMILITDGQDNSNVAAEHTLAVQNSITTYALGVGSGVGMSELIAATGDSSHVFAVDNFNALAAAMEKVCVEIAASTTATTVPTTTLPQPSRKSKSCDCENVAEEDKKYWLDIIYVIDSSSGVSANDFQSISTFLHLMQYMNIDQTGDPQFTRIGLVNTAATANRVANLTTITSTDELTKILDENFKQKGGDNFNVQAGLREASDMLEEEQSAHRRENVRKVVVVFSSASIDCKGTNLKAMSLEDSNILCELVSVMQDNGVFMITVGIKLASETEFPYIDIADECNQLDNTEDMTLNLLTALCRANCYCLEPYTQFVGGVDGCERYGECVYVHSLALSSTGALETCEKEGSILTPIWDQEKNEFLTELHLNANFFPFWVGMTCNDTQCLYSDGSETGTNDYTNWCDYQSQPDFSSGECVYEKQCKGFASGWFSDKCGHLLPTHYFSCQKDSCSVDNYCDYTSAANISTRKIHAKKPLQSYINI